MSLELIYRPGPNEVVQAAAKEWVENLKARNPLEPYGVALSGGRVARALFEAIGAIALRERLDWTEVHFFWADERCVPPTDAESNFAIAQAALFVPCQIKAQQIHRIHGEVEPGYAASEAEAELCRIMPLDASGQPILDLVFLGMGEDGHIASLFPQEPGTMLGDSRVYRPVVASKPPPNRITIGYQALIAARNVWVIASGAAKREALRSAAEVTGDLPVVKLVKNRHSVMCFNDIVL